MMKNEKCTMLVFVLITALMGCSTQRVSPVIAEGINDAIELAINDFLTSRLIKNDSRFSVTIHVDDEDVIILSIYGSDENKIFIGPDDKVGSVPYWFPTQYAEKEGKLFYWCDSTQVITNEIINVLAKFNHLDSTYVNGFNGDIPEFIINDSKKGADYYFCKKNLSRYRRVITNLSIGWYSPPKLDCSK